MSSVRVIGDSEFEAAVLQVEQTVLVYFWAAWCGPCRLMAPLMDKLAAQYGDRLTIIKMDVDPNPVSVAQYKVQGVPALLIFQNGELVQSSEGAISKQKLEEFVAPYL